MNLRSRLEVRQVNGLFRVVPQTAGFVESDNRLKPNPEPIREYVHKRTFKDNARAWILALRVEYALKNGQTLDLNHWEVFGLDELPADSLLPPRFLRR